MSSRAFVVFTLFVVTVLAALWAERWLTLLVHRVLRGTPAREYADGQLLRSRYLMLIIEGAVLPALWAVSLEADAGTPMVLAAIAISITVLILAVVVVVSWDSGVRIATAINALVFGLVVGSLAQSMIPGWLAAPVLLGICLLGLRLHRRSDKLNVETRSDLDAV